MFFHNIQRSLYKRLFGNELLSFKKIKANFIDKSGLEIGGPSFIFTANEILPVYEVANTIDGCNYSNSTVWEGRLQTGKNYKYQPNKDYGFQFICEGNDLTALQNGSYDFILSSHSLEHFANPIKALQEWKRVLKPNGFLVIVLPHPKFTFDNKRDITTFSHLLNDYENNFGEDDLTHLDEVVEMHDYSLTPDIESKTFMRERSLKNYENRCLHHHVFDINLMKQLFNFCNITFIGSDFSKPFHLIIYGRV